MELEFSVSISLGPHRSGDVTAEVEVSEEEYEALKQCCREEDEICDYPELENLYERIIAQVKEDDGIWECEDSDEELDPEDAEFAIQMPDDFYDAVEDES